MSEDDVRLDKWLWAARFFKTRALAQESVANGRVLIGGSRAKVSRSVRLGDEVSVRIGDLERVVIVLGVSAQRGPASVAQGLYEETAESIRRRVEWQAKRALAPEPAHAIEHGRPTKRDRRAIERMRHG